MKVARIVPTLLLLVSSLLYAESTLYEVQEHDTLYGISREFGVSVDDIMRVNSIEDPRHLKVGVRLLIPTTYVVQKGDTLFGIARRYNTTIDELLDLNGFAEDYMLKTGESIYVVSSIVGEYVPRAEETNNGQMNGVEDVQISMPDNRASVGSLPFWPHSGNRIDKIGKLTGLEIIGRKGDDVYTVATGEVVWSAPYRGYGNIVIIESVDRYLYLYGGNESVLVTIGQRVEAGAKIAKLGIDPHSGEARLFFGVYKGGEYIDPEAAPRG